MRKAHPLKNIKLTDAWERCFAAYGLAAPDPLLTRVLGAWSAPARRYHTIAHLKHCLNLLAAWSGDGAWPSPIGLAIFFHDVVYDPLRSDNEERSAYIAQATLTVAGVPQSVIQDVCRLILATRHAAAPTQADERLLIDIDLAILGAEPARYAEYTREVRKEYSMFGELDFAVGRLKVLEGFLGPDGRKELFHTELGVRTFDAAARANLSSEIRRLRTWIDGKTTAQGAP